MGIYEWARTGLRNLLFGADGLSLSPAEMERYNRYSELLAYQRGQHKRQLKPNPVTGTDDNLIVNWCGLVIERGISMLFGDGISFDLPGEGEETPEDKYIQDVLAANKEGILLHRLGQHGGTLGTCYVKILPGGIVKDGTALPKLVALNPAWMEINTMPHDMDEVLRYIQRYVIVANGEEEAHEITVERNRAVEALPEGGYRETGGYADAWTETHKKLSRETGWRWQEVSVTDWLYPFPPIVHWQNLPDSFSCYGQSDLADILPIQDRYNFNIGNISKIVRYHAHPKTWGVGQQSKELEWGADKMIWLAAANSGQTQPHIENLEMQSDLASSREHGRDLRDALMAVSRTTDPATIKDTVGTLTNFGLRVLFKDELHKTNTKRTLYGDGLLEVVRRLLVLGNFANTEPGEVVWPEPLPVNEVEQVQALTADIGNGLVSKQTASGERGWDWEQESERMKDEQEAADDVGTALLRAFGQGKGVPGQEKAPAPKPAVPGAV